MGWGLAAVILVGWAIGSNGAAGVFGTAVASRAISIRMAVLVAGAFVVLGAYLSGMGGIHTYGSVASLSGSQAVAVTAVSGAVMAILSMLGLPASGSQTVVGALAGHQMSHGTVQWMGFATIALCWFATPVAGAVMAMVVHRILGALRRWAELPLLVEDRVIKYLLLISGAYGAYNFGANDIANVAGPVVVGGVMEPSPALVAGGLAMALGVATLGPRVMLSAGQRIVPLTPFGALVVVLSQALTVQIFLVVGVPVSVTQAMVGAIVGIGLLKSEQTVDWRMVGRIVFAWGVTPPVAGVAVYLAEMLL